MRTTPDKPPTLNHWMPAIVTLVVLVAALSLILRPSADPNSRVWAGGIVGAIIAHWLPRPGRGG